MYRILAANQPVRERRNQLEHGGATPSPSWWPPGSTRCGPGTSLDCWDRHAGPTSTSTSCSTSSDVALDGRQRENHASRSHRAPGPHPALRPRGAHDQQMHRASPTWTRSLSRPQVSRQPLLEAVQDPGTTPACVDIHAAIACLPVAWYNTEHRHAESSCSHPMTSITAVDDTPCCNNVNRPCAPPGVIIERFVRGTKPLPLPECHIHNRTDCSVNRNRRCLKVVDRFLPALRFDRWQSVEETIPANGEKNVTVWRTNLAPSRPIGSHEEARQDRKSLIRPTKQTCHGWLAPSIRHVALPCPALAVVTFKLRSVHGTNGQVRSH